MPVISILGATGQQGSAVLRSILSDGTFTPRALTRNPDSPASQALAAQGVQVVKADLWDTESIKEALAGSDLVFGVTNFWDPSVFPGTPNGVGEITQGKNLVDAAKAVGIKFFVWSALPSSKLLSGGKYPDVYHIDSKAEVWDYLKESGVPCAAVDTPYFAENLWTFAMQKNEAGTGYIIPVPYTAEALQSFLWVSHDLGPAALALLKNFDDPERKGQDVLGKAFPIVSFIETYPEVAKRISAAIGKEVVFVPIETCGLHELDQMYRYQADFGMYRDLPIPNPDLVALGFKAVGTLDELIETQIVPRFK
ncbi:hypothetical protein FB45DRAFT_869541 [Roridomyces roridus]|uniref:NmrA-like domain-containing protein n=1 Tax=Roridomyces roridus TaxID=1738132 RepID=A0AAD7BLE2_9AGAR|nr:hypothetical protein FB45DRAFT_869541 [Roridomyces roridus]